MVGNGYDGGLGREGRADVAVFPVGREDRHAGAVGNDDAGLFFVGHAVEHRDVILPTHHHPDFLAVRREERLMRRAPDVRHVFDRVGGGIDEVHRIRADRDNRNGVMIGRES